MRKINDVIFQLYSEYFHNSKSGLDNLCFFEYGRQGWGMVGADMYDPSRSVSIQEFFKRVARGQIQKRKSGTYFTPG